MLLRSTIILAIISTQNKYNLCDTSGDTTFGTSHFGPAQKLDNVYIDINPINIHIANLDTLLRFQIPSKSFFSSSSISSSKLYNTLYSIKSNAKSLKNLIDKSQHEGVSKSCTIINLQDSINDVFLRMQNIDTRNKRSNDDIDFNLDEEYRQLYNDRETQYQTFLQINEGNDQIQTLEDIKKDIITFSNTKDKTILAGIRIQLCDMVNNKKKELLKYLLFSLLKEFNIITKLTLEEIPKYSPNDLKSNILACIGKLNVDICPDTETNNTNDFDNDSDTEQNESRENEINFTDEERDLDQTISDLNAERQKEKKFTIELQKKGLVCSTPYIKGSCDRIRSVIKNNLIKKYNADPAYFETMKLSELTYKELIDNIETSYERHKNIEDSYTHELIFGDKIDINLDILNAVIYKHSETKKDKLIENLLPIEKTLQFVLKSITNIFNAKNEIIDKSYYKNCPVIKEEKELGIVNSKLFYFRDKTQHSILLEILPFCYGGKCFKIQLNNILTFKDGFCNYIASSENRKFGFCEKFLKEIPSCAYAKKQSIECIFKAHRPKKQYSLLQNMVYICHKDYNSCEYYKFAVPISSQYITDDDINSFETTLDNLNVSFTEQYESELINGLVTLCIIITSAIIIKCVSFYLKQICKNTTCKHLSCGLCKNKDSNHIESYTLRTIRATLDPNLP